MSQVAIYPLYYAARLAGLDVNTARRWMRGHRYRHKGKIMRSAPVLHLINPNAKVNAELNFEELLTLRLVRAFREEGHLSLLTIREAARVAAVRYGVGNPFVTKMFYSDGRKIFLELQKDNAVQGRERVLVEAMTGQQQFKEVVEPSLFRNVVFIGNAPAEWRPEGKERSVVIRPDRAFGAPHIEGTGIRTDVLADAVRAEGGGESAITAVASWFGITEMQVSDAVAAEVEWQQHRKN